MSRPTLEDIDDATWLALRDVVGSGTERQSPFGAATPAAAKIHVVVVREVTGEADDTTVNYKVASFNRRSVWAEAGWDGGGRLSRVGNVGIAAIATSDSSIPFAEKYTFTVSIQGHRIPCRLTWRIGTTPSGGSTTWTDDSADLSQSAGWSTEIVLEPSGDSTQELADLSVIPAL